jgi:peptidoglycan/xylan/chitin deacetylase (PgdA/CDA1 family)
MMAGHSERGLPEPQAAPATAEDMLGLSEFPLILMYHHLAEVAGNRMCVSPRRFAEQMTWLKRHGLRGVAVGTLVDAMRAGRQRGLVGITFDDGYHNLVEAALPVLLRHGFTATMFIISGLLGGTNEWEGVPVWPLMSADQVRELAAAGMEIGSHSTTHLRLPGVAAQQLEAEVSESRASLGELIGAQIRGFAYPYGSMDTAARHAVRDAGYDYACTIWTPMTELGFMALPRMYIGERDNAFRMAVKRLVYRPFLAVYRPYQEVHGRRA